MAAHAAKGVVEEDNRALKTSPPCISNFFATKLDFASAATLPDIPIDSAKVSKMWVVHTKD